MRFVLAAALAALACPIAQAQTLMSKPEFRDAFIAALVKKWPDSSPVATGDLAVTSMVGGKSQTLQLDTGYREYLTSPDHSRARLDAIVDKWVAALAVSASGTEDLRSRLVYVLRHRDYLAQTAAGNAEVVSRPFAGDLIEIMMVDGDATMHTVRPYDLTAGGFSTDAAWKIADANIPKRMGKIAVGDLNGDGPFAYSADSGLATALLADPKACQPAGGMLGNGEVVLVISREIWISTLPKDPLSASRFWAFAKPLLGKGQLMSDTPLTCRAGKWEIAKPPA